MKYFKPLILLLCICIANIAQAREWDLRTCIDYARENNIQVQSAILNLMSADETLLQAQAARYPSLSASSNQGVSFVRSNDPSYSGSYSIGSGITLYNGGRIGNSIRRAEVDQQAGELNVEAAQNNIEIAVTQAYLNILYSRENVKASERTLETAKAQWERAKTLYEEGSISRSEYAQFESQYSADRYQQASAQSALAQNILALKQLLELDGDEEFIVIYPKINDADVLSPVPAVSQVYAAALEVLPDMKSSRLGIESAVINEKIAASTGMPSISASASAGSGNYSGRGSMIEQISNNVNGTVGVTLSIPIYSNRSVKTAKNQAHIATMQAELSYANARKSLYSTIEGLYQDVISAQSRYAAAQDKLRSAEVSYGLMNEKFNEGMINPVELLAEKNTYISAQQELLQAKYQAILSMQLLNFYQGKNIEIR